MASMCSRSVDAIITDPPYNIGKKYRSSDDMLPPAQYEKWCRQWFAECERVTRSVICISVGINNVPVWCRIREPLWMVCWSKLGAPPNYTPVSYINLWEPVMIYGKPVRRVAQDVVKAHSSRYDLDGNHPCAKPIEWAKQLVDGFTLPGMTILDPFMGIGTTGVACAMLRRVFLGIELDPTYFAVAERRIVMEYNGLDAWMLHDAPARPERLR